jgi:hypothetical protein
MLPDGKTFLGLGVVSLREGKLRMVVKSGSVCCGLTWVDDDTVVVGQKTENPLGSRLVAVNADGRGHEQPVVSGDGYFHDPDWSEQGGLLFVHSTDTAASAGEVRATGSLPMTQLADTTLWARAGDFPAWDPSGTQVAYLHTDSSTRKQARYDLFIATDPDSGAPAEDLPGDAVLGPPAWGSR